MQAQDWVVLAEQDAESSIRDGEAGLLFLEAVLNEEGIRTLFDPYRPGQWIGPGYGSPAHVRLLVMQEDLERARQILVDLESSAPVESEEEADSEAEDGTDEAEEWRESDVMTTEPSPREVDPRATTFAPPMDKPINPGCATLLLPAIIVVGLLLT